jgi:hypothetical protein
MKTKLLSNSGSNILKRLVAVRQRTILGIKYFTFNEVSGRRRAK